MGKDNFKGLEELLYGNVPEGDVPEVDTEMEDEIIFINTDDITNQAKCDAYNMVENLTKVYGNEAFMEEHPDYKKRIDIELENLRTYIKMKRADEEIHDLLVRAIGKNSTNASLYGALNRMQTSILQIQKQMDETITRLNNLLKNYQFELPFDEEKEEEKDVTEVGTVTRGTKEFINQMNALQKSEPVSENEIFADEEDEDAQ